MKILAIDQGEHLGGAERFFSELMGRLSENHELHVVCGDNPKYHQLYQGSQAQLHKTEIPRLKPMGLRSVLSLKRAQKNLREIVKSLKPDLIISNTVRTHILSSSIAQQASIPLIWMGHDMTFPKVLLKMFLKYPQKIICCSHFVANFFSNQNTEVLYPFGIQQQRLEVLQSVPKQHVVGMVGKFIPWKGQLEFLKAAQTLSVHFPDYQFILVADEYQGVQESHEYAKKCREFILKHQLEGVVTIKSGIPDLLDELSTWEILVHASQKPEPLGRVILEGMAAGCAVVVGDRGGPTELVKNHENGLLIHPDIHHINLAVQSLLNDPQKLLRLQQEARQSLKGFTWELQIKKFQHILSTLSKEQRSS